MTDLSFNLSFNRLNVDQIAVYRRLVGDDTECLERGSAVRSSCANENLSLRLLNIFLYCPIIVY